MQQPVVEVAQIHGNKINIRLGNAIISIWAACSLIFQTTFLLRPKKPLSLFRLKHMRSLLKKNEKMCQENLKKDITLRLFTNESL
jgi:hypothetical protein